MMEVRIIVVAAALVLGGTILTNVIAGGQRDAKGAASVSPTIDPATCAAYIIAGRVANRTTMKHLDIVAAKYQKEGDSKVVAVKRAKRWLVLDAFGWCTLLQETAESQ